MASNPTNALHLIRQNVQRRASTPPSPPTKAFDDQREPYRIILEEVHILGGDSALTELTDWIIEETTTTGSLPEIPAVRTHARRICDNQGVIIPDDSPLRDEITL